MGWGEGAVGGVEEGVCLGSFSEVGWGGEGGGGEHTSCGPRGGREESIIFVGRSAILCGGGLCCWKLVWITSMSGFNLFSRFGALIGR